MESVAEVVFAQVGRTDFGGRNTLGELISWGEENGFGNVLDVALARGFFLRVSSETFDGEGHVS